MGNIYIGGKPWDSANLFLIYKGELLTTVEPSLIEKTDLPCPIRVVDKLTFANLANNFRSAEILFAENFIQAKLRLKGLVRVLALVDEYT